MFNTDGSETNKAISATELVDIINQDIAATTSEYLLIQTQGGNLTTNA